MDFIVLVRQISIAVTSIICATFLFSQQKWESALFILGVGIIIHFIDIHISNEHEKRITNPYN